MESSRRAQRPHIIVTRRVSTFPQTSLKLAGYDDAESKSAAACCAAAASWRSAGAQAWELETRVPAKHAPECKIYSNFSITSSGGLKCTCSSGRLLPGIRQTAAVVRIVSTAVPALQRTRRQNEYHDVRPSQACVVKVGEDINAASLVGPHRPFASRSLYCLSREIKSNQTRSYSSLVGACGCEPRLGDDQRGGPWNPPACPLICIIV